MTLAFFSGRVTDIPKTTTHQCAARPSEDPSPLHWRVSHTATNVVARVAGRTTAITGYFHRPLQVVRCRSVPRFAAEHDLINPTGANRISNMYAPISGITRTSYNEIYWGRRVGHQCNF
jgi:hypothetical protein